jgi:hypothetical protein
MHPELVAICFAAVVGMILFVIMYGVVRDRSIEERHRRAMLAAWFCTRCGYDERATPSENCPECGAAIPPKFPRSPAR